jgi:hypothetical protein
MRNVLETVRYEKSGFGDVARFPWRAEVPRGRGESSRSEVDNTRAATRTVIRWKKEGMPLCAAFYVRNNLPKLRKYLETHHQLEKVGYSSRFSMFFSLYFNWWRSWANDFAFLALMQFPPIGGVGFIYVLFMRITVMPDVFHPPWLFTRVFIIFFFFFFFDIFQAFHEADVACGEVGASVAENV